MTDRMTRVARGGSKETYITLNKEREPEYSFGRSVR